MTLTHVVTTQTIGGAGSHVVAGREAGVDDHGQQEVGQADADPHHQLLAEAALQGAMVVPGRCYEGHLRGGMKKVVGEVVSRGAHRVFGIDDAGEDDVSVHTYI